MNDDDAEYCSKCGTPLKGNGEDSHGRRYHDRDARYHHRNECFGLPNGGLIVGIVFGILLILFGISSIYGFAFWDYVWPLVVVLFGILIVVSAIYNYTRRR
jgi:hypothetical protein